MKATLPNTVREPATREETAKRAARSDRIVDRGGELFYCIEAVDRMPPFLVNLVSSGNHWMFVGSHGALTAGRRNADNALFPYCTQDKLFDLRETTGSLTLLRVHQGGSSILWRPFWREAKEGVVVRRLFKSLDGRRLVFEEDHLGLELRFAYEWTFSDRYGFARRSQLTNLGKAGREAEVLDGVQNLVPYGLDAAFLNQFSNLADAYKKNELVAPEGLGIYYLSSIPTDRAEPSEGLKATVAWRVGGPARATLLSTQQVSDFVRGEPLGSELDTRARRGAYLAEGSLSLEGGASEQWWTVADINRDACQIESLRAELADPKGLLERLLADIEENGRRLRAKVAASDGLQLTGESSRDARHRSNALFNIMRGGIFDGGYEIDTQDYLRYLSSLNRRLASGARDEVKSLGRQTTLDALKRWAEQSGDLDLLRLTSEYLPLSFSRRHGDPSRPWNKFSIETEDEAGNPALAYQGNWRDLFQNWEALAYSFPRYLPGMVSKFLNASTADGYNPYRVTRDGFDWEVLDPHEPWSNIGYWGDHQIIYLLKLLEGWQASDAEGLTDSLASRGYVYAHVPYRIKSFAEMWSDPQQTIDFDDEAAAELERMTRQTGGDGKLLRDLSGQPARASLLEKLLVPLLSKLSNFVPDGGIWMNTQRPEWNDANNALVGNGISMVTLCYVYRYIRFLERTLKRLPGGARVVADACLGAHLSDIASVLVRFQPQLETAFDASSRFAMMRALGESGERYRAQVYGGRLGAEQSEIGIDEVLEFLRLAGDYGRQSILANRRDDGLFHAYNLIDRSGDDAVEIGRLYEMLEGQVAALSSGLVEAEEACRLLDGLRSSALYREDADSYMLYPDRELPRFLEKNRAPAKEVEAQALLRAMLKSGDGRIVQRDRSGVYRFNGGLRNAASARQVVLSLKDTYGDLASPEAAREVGEIFESAFDHKRFTGRSGTFFAYEGLGSIYWHMVSKLVLAVQEVACAAMRDGASPSVLDKLRGHYRSILAGLGMGKSAAEYGAFPTDAYSHTPRHAGAQQPGMTGQVKEDLLVRWRELGALWSQGRLEFSFDLLDENAFLDRPMAFSFVDKHGRESRLQLDKNQLAFTLCQTPVVVTRSGRAEVRLWTADGKSSRFEGLGLPEEASQAIARRDASLERIEVSTGSLGGRD